MSDTSADAGVIQSRVQLERLIAEDELAGRTIAGFAAPSIGLRSCDLDNVTLEKLDLQGADGESLPERAVPSTPMDPVALLAVALADMGNRPVTGSVLKTHMRKIDPMFDENRQGHGSFLDFLRATVVMKATGLTDEQARRSLVPSRLTTVTGLVSHLTYVEQYWFGVLYDGRADEWLPRFADDSDAEFTAGLHLPVEQVIADYEAECRRSREVAAAHDLADTAVHKSRPVNLRWVLIHMIEETGRHAGHLYLLRELLDGSTGE